MRGLLVRSTVVVVVIGYVCGGPENSDVVNEAIAVEIPGKGQVTSLPPRVDILDPTEYLFLGGHSRSLQGGSVQGIVSS